MEQKKLKIAMLGHKRIPSREGGIEVVVEELATRMVKMGHCVTCYNRNGDHSGGRKFDIANLKEYRGIRIKHVATINRRGLAAVTSSVSAALCAAFGKYDVVHFHAEGPAFMCWLPKLFGKRIIVTVHGLDHQRAKWGKLAKTYILLGEKSAVKYADDIIVLSEHVRRYFQEVYSRNTHFIPNGVNRPENCPAEVIQREFGLEKDSYILFLGRIVPEKGLNYLIEAFKEVKTDKRLVIAGGSSDMDAFMSELMQIAAEDERILFTGFVQGKILEELYSNAYVYTLPSDLEGMPISLLEAMSYGNCCVVSDIPECAEVVEDMGVVFQRGSVEDLKTKLQMLCDDGNMVARYRASAADFICRKYNWDDIVEKTLELYFMKPDNEK